MSSSKAEESLDDMRGLQLGGGSASPVHNVVPAWLEMNGKPRDFIRLLRLDPAVVDISLIEGKIDLAECWLASNWPLLRKQAKAAGVALDWIAIAIWGSMLTAAALQLARNTSPRSPKSCAISCGHPIAASISPSANPEQAADIAVKMFPTLDRAVVLEQIREINDLMIDPQVSRQTAWLSCARIACAAPGHSSTRPSI